MIVKCDICDWERTSASNLAELEFMFHHGPDEGHHKGVVMDDDKHAMRIVVADDIWLRLAKPEAVEPEKKSFVWQVGYYFGRVIFFFLPQSAGEWINTKIQNTADRLQRYIDAQTNQ